MSQPEPTALQSGRPHPRGPTGSSPMPAGRYDFLLRDLRDRPWQPPGADDEERLASLRERAIAMFATEPVEGTLPAVYTFFGQLVAHDLSFDAREGLVDSGTLIPSHRSPRFDLDSVYGLGPHCHPWLYQLRDPRKLVIGRNPSGEPDLPRNGDASLDNPLTREGVNVRRTALVGDPRNDENVVVAQLHLAFLAFHNRMVDEGHGFEEARRLTRLHYQWILLHEYLADLCGRVQIERTRDARRAERLFDPSWPAFVPFEFAFAAFRFGHSMLGPRYHLNDALERERGGAGFAFTTYDALDWRGRDRAAAQILDGHRVLPRRWTVQWDRFLGGDPPSAQRAQRIDATLTDELRYLPLPVDEEIERRLAYRTLLRGWQLRLPSGQTVARHLGLEPLESEHEGGDPLWIYVLREAEAASSATRERLGPVGTRIVLETVLHLLRQDPDSLLSVPGWTPTVTDGQRFTLREFLRFAGMPVTREEWIRVAGDGGAA